MTVGCHDSIILIGHLRSFDHPLHPDLIPDVSTPVLPLGTVRSGRENCGRFGAPLLHGGSVVECRGRGFETYRRRVVSLSKTLYSPKVLVNYPGSGGSVPT